MAILDSVLRGFQAAETIKAARQNQAFNQLRMIQAQQAIDQFPLQQRLQQLQITGQQQQNRQAKRKLQQEDALQIFRGANAALNALDDGDDNTAKLIMSSVNDQLGLGLTPESINEMNREDLIRMKSRGLPFIDSSGTPVRSSVIKEDGTVITIKDTGPEVIAPNGEPLTGDAAEDQIRKANEFEDNRAVNESMRKRLSQQSIEISGQAFDTLPKIRSGISDIDRAITLLKEEGAKSGPFQSRLPSIKASSIELNNLRARMGLNVISMATFGALNESELNLALDVGLPTGLDEPELIDFLERKRAAQEKVAKELTDLAVFMGQGGTVSEYIKQRQSETGSSQDKPKQNTKRIKINAQGERVN